MDLLKKSERLNLNKYTIKESPSRRIYTRNRAEHPGKSPDMESITKHMEPSRND